MLRALTGGGAPTPRSASTPRTPDSAAWASAASSADESDDDAATPRPRRPSSASPLLAALHPASGRPPWPASLVVGAASAAASMLPAPVTAAARRALFGTDAGAGDGDGGGGWSPIKLTASSSAAAAASPSPSSSSPRRRVTRFAPSPARRRASAAAAAGPPPPALAPPLAFDVATGRGGVTLRADLPADTLLSELCPALAAAAGPAVDPASVSIIVVEDRARAGAPGIARSARAAARRLAAPAPGDPRGALLAWFHYLLLPEPLARELRGRGLVGWARSTAAWEAVFGGADAGGTAAAAPPAAARKPAPPASVPLRVELLSGEVLTVRAAGGTTLAAARRALEREVGLLSEAQRWLGVVTPPPGRLTALASSVAVASLRLAASAARRAAGTAAALAGVVDGGRYAVVVRRPGGGAPLEFDVPAGATMAQVRAAVDAACGGGGAGGGPAGAASPARSVALVFPAEGGAGGGARRGTY